MYCFPEKTSLSCLLRLLPGINFRVESLAYCAVKVGGISCLKHNAEVIAVGPIAFGSKLCLYTFVKDCARQRIRERDTDLIRAKPANKLNRLLQLGPGLARVTKLQKETGPDVGLLQSSPRCDDVAD